VYVGGERKYEALAPGLKPSSLRLRSLASYPRLALCPRNPLPIKGWAEYFSPTPMTKPPGGPGGPTQPPPHPSKRLYFKILAPNF